MKTDVLADILPVFATQSDCKAVTERQQKVRGNAGIFVQIRGNPLPLK